MAASCASLTFSGVPFVEMLKQSFEAREIYALPTWEAGLPIEWTSTERIKYGRAFST